MRVRLGFASAIVAVVVLAACAGRRTDPDAELVRMMVPCEGTTVALVSNFSDRRYYVVAWNGTKEVMLGTADPGVTRYDTDERVYQIRLIAIEHEPLERRNGRLVSRGYARVKKECA